VTKPPVIGRTPDAATNNTLVGAFKSGFAKLRFGGLSERRDGSIPKMDFRRSHRPGRSRHSRD
jgi:hypothetical protein